MAAQPPPYSPRDYRRAQRYYWRSLRRPSIVGPVVLIGAGVVALLVELGRLSAAGVWDWYLRWWPLLLIVLGLISLGEWWLDRHAPYAGQRRYGGVVVLLLLLVLIGLTERGYRRGFGLWGGNGFFLRLSGYQHWGSYSMSQPLPAGALLLVQTGPGDVGVAPSSDNQIHIQEEAVVYAANDDDARAALDALHPQLTVNGKNVILRTAKHGDGRANLILRVPADALVSIVSSHGNVDVEDLATPVEVASNHGNVTLMRLKSQAHARMNHGDFTAQSVAKGISVEGWMNNVSISGIGGDALLDGSVLGHLNIAQVGSQVHLHTSRTEVGAAALAGQLSLDSGTLRIQDATGPVTISTRAKDIDCSGISGGVNIENKNGEVDLSIAGQPGVTRVENQNGAIRLVLPPSTAFTLQATARNGNISSAFGLPVERSGRGETVFGQVGGGGSEIELISHHGDIKISKSVEAASGSGTKVENGARRLRAPAGAPPVIQTQ